MACHQTQEGGTPGEDDRITHAGDIGQNRLADIDESLFATLQLPPGARAPFDYLAGRQGAYKPLTGYVLRHGVYVYRPSAYKSRTGYEKKRNEKGQFVKKVRNEKVKFFRGLEEIEEERLEDRMERWMSVGATAHKAKLFSQM